DPTRTGRGAALAALAKEGSNRMSETLLTQDGVQDFAAGKIVVRPRTESHLEQRTLATRAKATLLGSKIYTLRKLHVEDAEGAIILRGRVESFYHKQLAQELI